MKDRIKRKFSEIYNKLNKRTLLIIFAYLIITFFLSWPLIFHLDGFLLSKNYDDITHSDAKNHINYMLKSKDLFLEHKDFIIVPKNYALAQTYNLFGVIATIFFGLNEIIFHNLYFLISIFLSGLFIYLLMLELSKDKISSFFAGFLYMSSNYIFHQYIWGHTNIWQIQWIPLIFLFLEKTIKYEKIKYSLYLGIALALQILSSSQYIVYLSFIIPLYLLLRIFIVDKKILINKKFYLNMFISLITAFVLSSFYLVKRIGLSSVIRTIEENMMWYWRLNNLNELLSFGENISIGPIHIIFLGFGLFVLWMNIKNKDYRKYFIYLILFIFIIIAMFGPFSKFAPYYWLYKIWPFVKNFRVLRRLFPFVLMSSSILSSLFLLYLKDQNKSEKYRIMILIISIFVMIILQILNSHWTSNLWIYYP